MILLNLVAFIATMCLYVELKLEIKANEYEPNTLEAQLQMVTWISFKKITVLDEQCLVDT